MDKIGTVRMTTPTGGKSSIEVSRTETGSVDIVFSRTSEGEALVRLPVHAAKELARLLAEAVALQPTT
jgi:hypothetical protein